MKCHQSFSYRQCHVQVKHFLLDNNLHSLVNLILLFDTYILHIIIMQLWKYTTVRDKFWKRNDYDSLEAKTLFTSLRYTFCMWAHFYCIPSYLSEHFQRNINLYSYVYFFLYIFDFRGTQIIMVLYRNSSNLLQI